MDMQEKSISKALFRIRGLERQLSSDKRSPPKTLTGGQAKVVTTSRRIITAGKLTGDKTTVKSSRQLVSRHLPPKSESLILPLQDSTTDFARRQLALLHRSTRELNSIDNLDFLADPCSKIKDPVINPESLKTVVKLIPNKKTKVDLVKDSVK